MQFLFITNSPEMARHAVHEGGATIFVDLELIGKVERQGHLNTVISRHSFTDVRAIRLAVPKGRLLVRLNPAHDGSPNEIDSAITAGADMLMLPMFRTMSEVEFFSGHVAGRVKLCLLAETRQAMEGIADFATVPGVDQVHIGLNDLSLDLGLSFMFEPLALGLIDTMAAQLRAAGTPFGIGGLARADEGLLPARLLISEHVRLGSSAAILSRTFHRQAATVDDLRATMDFGAEVRTLEEIEAAYRNADPSVLEANRHLVTRQIRQIVAQIRGG